MIDTSIQRVEINQVIENQLPEFVQSESPLFVDFMKQYYISQEYQGGSINIAENLDRYTKLQTYVGAALTEFTGLSTNTESFSDTIFVDSTKGYPSKYGLLKIDDEIITYTGIGTTSFTGCVRGFSGVDAMDQPTRPDLLSFNTSTGVAHTGGTKVFNLSNLFIRDFFKKLKTTFASGFEQRKFDSDLDQVKFIRQVKDFYRTKGTDESYKILFRALYGEEVNIIKPSEFLIKPSDADYGFAQDFVVKAITGDPRNLKGSTLFQDLDKNDKTILGASGAISDVKDFVVDGDHYYQISISKDSIEGHFKVPGRTRITDPISIGSTVMTVDTTVGFPTSGSLSLPTAVTAGVVTYTSKTSNQFLGISSAVDTQSIGDDVRYNNVAYGYSFASGTNKIEVLITGVLKDFPIPKETYYFNKGDKVRVGTFGINKSSEDSNFGSWVYNTTVKQTPKNVTKISSSSFNIVTQSDHKLLEEDSVEVLDANSNVIGLGRVLSTINSSTLILGDLPGVNEFTIAFIRRKIKRGNSSLHDNITKYTVDVQNVYEESNDSMYVASPSLPSLGNEPIVAPDRSITWTGATGGDVIQLIQVTEGAADHGFYSGEVVTYNVISGFLGQLIDGNNYFISRVDSNNIRLANSLPDLINQNFVNATGTGTFKISVPELANKKLDHQKLLKKIPLTPTFDGNQYQTIPGTTGILVNGTEISNYKSGDVIQFGGVESVDVLEGGSGYDIINPPKITIESLAGAGVSATPVIKGQIDRIDIVDPGFDYTEPPVIQITGGNGKNAVLRSRLKQIDHFVDFDASSTGNAINIADDTIGFGTFHKFRDGEAVIYKTFNTGAIGIASAGITTTAIQNSPDQRLVDESIYFVSRVNASTIKLANTKNDALTKSNLLNITGFADGSQRFQSLNKKLVLGDVIVENPGEGFENKRRLIPTAGINTYSDFIEYTNHGFEDGEIIRYSNNEVKIGGLDTDQDYYVLKINDSQFRLASAGIGTTLSDANYLSKQFVGLTSVGSGEHIFNYPPIQVSVKGIIGINTSVGVGTTSNDSDGEDFNAIINPIVRGSITSVNVEKAGIGYGASTTFNFAIPPTVRVSSGSSSEYKAIVTGGKIQSVIVTRSGEEYTSTPDLVVLGDGVGAKVVSTISNGRVNSVTVKNGGVGYTTSLVSVQESIPGSGAVFLPKIRSWAVNNVKRYEDIFYDDDGFLSRGDNDEGIKFTSFYAPRGLRKILKSKNSDGTIDYASNDLNILNNAEQVSLNHSPIIGWAYDGNPIYGPYGYDRKDGGNVRIMRSSYSLKTSRENGPPISTFPLGFFIEDYEYLANGDLDENNGRYCITPDYPKGTYAYFATINPNENETSGTFKNFRSPSFPYLIGVNFAAKPDDWNFVETNNQNIDLNTLNLRRNTNPYKLDAAGSEYEGIFDSRKKVLQEIEVDFSSSGKINQYEVESAGSGYKVNEKLNIKNLDEGSGLSAKISAIDGKEIVSIASTVIKVENIVFSYDNRTGNVIGLSSQPHGLLVGDVINVSGLSTDTLRRLDGQHRIGFSTSRFLLNVGLGTTGATGIVTSIDIAGDLSARNINSNDVLGISTERMLVLDVDNVNGKVKVQREFDGVLGTAHSAGNVVTSLNRSISFNIGINTNVVTNVNIPRFFNPVESVSLGSTAGVGVGNTIVYTFGVAGGRGGRSRSGISSIFVRSQQIYLPGHGFKTGDKLLYSNGGGVSLRVNNTLSTFSLPDNSPVFAINEGRDFLGISTNPLGIGSTGSVTGIGSTAYQLFFINNGIGVKHSFTPQKEEITGFVEKIVGTVICKENHNLLQNDSVSISLTPGISTSYNVEYDDLTKRTIINSRSFGSSNVNTTTSVITLNDHRFHTGDKVIYKSTDPATPLINNDVYFIVRIDDNSFKLSETNFKSKKLIPDTITITATGDDHTIALINPQLNLTRGYKVGFAVSDTSLTQEVSGKRTKIFDFNFFRDPNFTNPYFNNDEDGGFQVVGVGTVGVTTTARVDLSLTDNTPEELFYKLVPVNLNIDADDKRNPVVDTDVINYSTLKITDSEYNGTYNITGIGSTTFTFNLPRQPEKDGYTKNEAVTLKYSTSSTTASGPINKIQFVSKGRNYRTIPVVTSIASTQGVGGIVRFNSTETGSLKRYTTKNIGFDYSADKTIQPSVQLPQIIRLDRLSTIANIGISSGGKNYLEPPRIIVIDRVTGKVNTDIVTTSELQGTSVSKVTILRNTNSLYDTNPKIVATNNTNGIKVKNLSYTAPVVTLTLEGEYNTTTYPFTIGDPLYVENIGIGSTGSGFNSSDYNYESFVITGVNTNPGGGNATVSYNLDSSVTNPGIFSGPSSSGRAIPFQDIAQFNIGIKPNQFSVGEIVSTGDKSGTVVDWNEDNKYLKVLSNDSFDIGESINGQSSKSVAFITQINRFTSNYEIDSNSEVRSGFRRETGKLNTELQKIQDSDYYQNFSYSLNSPVQYETWKDPVNSLTHVVGFKNFADVSIVSIASTDDKNRRNASVGVSSSVAVVVSDLVSEKESLHNSYDFDLVTENSKNIGGLFASDEINFSNKILTDYIESRTNRVIPIDSVSSQFNDLPRATAFSDVASFDVTEVDGVKFYVLLFDQRFSGEKQIVQVNLLHDESLGYMMPFGRVETAIDLGEFDFAVSGTTGNLRFLPAKSKNNNYALRIFAIETFKNTQSGISTLSLGTGYDIISTSSGIGSTDPSPVQVVGFGSTAITTSKLFVQTQELGGQERTQINELLVLNDSEEVYLLDYAQMINENTSQTNAPSVGLGTFGADVRSGITSVYFTPETGIGVTMRVHQVAIGGTATGIGSTTVSLTEILTTTTNIASTGTPQQTRISGINSGTYTAFDALIEIHDTTNDRYAVTQVTAIHDTITPYFTEFGYMDNFSNNNAGIGTIGIGYSSTSGGDIELRLTPPANTAVTTKVFQYNFTETGTGGVGFVTFTDSRLKAQEGSYTGTDNDIKFSFNLTHTGDPIFHKTFNASEAAVVDVTNNTFVVDNHFFQTGEEITYTPTGAGTTMSIGIAATTVVGFGLTNKLPSTVYAVKIAENKFKVCGTATEALQPVPSVLDISAVGVGTTHSFTSKNLNSKVLVTLDNNIQSPVIQSPIETNLSFDAGTTTDFITLVGISSFFSGDIIKVNDEFMKIDTVGIGSTNRMLVNRGQLNSALANHSAGDTVTKFLGNYQIVKDTINFTDAPKGSKGPAGLTTTSTFVGRVFTHTGAPGGTQETYSNNFVFDTVEDQFTGIATNFILKSSKQNVTGFATNTGVILLNEIFQNPGDDYNIVETAGITSVSFTGVGVTNNYDVNVSSVPRGGIIVSVGETTNFGYQPLVAAGGTAIVSSAGTVTSVSIGNSGSGYRVGLQTNILVRARGSSGIVTIGKANVSAGLVTSVTITNGGGSGFSQLSPPTLEFEKPLNYADMRLVGSSTGIGASVSVRVGAASSIISFEITNFGYNYRIGDVLTIEEGGQAGILTDANKVVQDFELTVLDTFNDSFAGFTFGELEKLNSFEDQFDGNRKSFNLTKTIGASETLITLRAAKGAPIKVEYNCLIFLNDILQVPFESYVFNGGSQVTFSEAPKADDKVRIYYYRGSEHDVVDVDILETVKKGDKLTINKYPDIGLDDVFQQEPRTVTGITTSDSVTTNTYIDAGITTVRTLQRPVTWKKQIQDVVVDNIGIGKDRVELEPGIRPTAYLIKNVSAGSTEIFVDTAVPLFNQVDDIVETKQSILILDRTTKTGVAATAIVSGTGGISTVSISDGGSGYTAAPHVSIGVTAGIGTITAGIGTTTTNATAIATVSGVGTISAVTIVNAGAGYTNTNPPVVMIEAESITQDTLTSLKYDGDFGDIVGIATTAVAGIGTALQLDFYIPDTSILRDTSVMSSAISVSGIQSGYYFTAFETNVGSGVTSYESAIGNDNGVVGAGTIHIDNIYKVHSAKNITGPALLSTGVGNTTLRRVTVSVDNLEGIVRPVGVSTIINGLYYGKFSWCRLHDFVKEGTSAFTAITNDGVTGIKTGPVFIRTSDLKESFT